MRDKTETQLLAQQAEIMEIAANPQIERLDELNRQLNRIANALEASVLLTALTLCSPSLNYLSDTQKQITHILDTKEIER